MARIKAKPTTSFDRWVVEQLSKLSLSGRGGSTTVVSSSAGATTLSGITGVSPGSIPFGSSISTLTQDNANLYWDDTNNRIGVGTSTPNSDVHAGSLSLSVRSISSSDTASTTDYLILCDASSGVMTVTLPVVSTCSGRTYQVKKVDSSVNAVTIDGDGSETIDGGVTATMTAQYESITVYSDGTEWWII